MEADNENVGNGDFGEINENIVENQPNIEIQDRPIVGNGK